MNRSIEKPFSLFASFCVALFICGCRGGQPSKPDHPPTASGVEMQDISFYSMSLGRTVPYRVYLPALHPPGQKFPVIYLLHGGGADYRSWSNQSDVVQYARTGLILVMPDDDESYYMNEVESPRNRYKDYMTSPAHSVLLSTFPFGASMPAGSASGGSSEHLRANGKQREVRTQSIPTCSHCESKTDPLYLPDCRGTRATARTESAICDLIATPWICV